MNGSRLIAGCFRFIVGSRYAESTRSKFGVSAYSRINTVFFVAGQVNIIKHPFPMGKEGSRQVIL